jgi:hypothetical protein
MAGNLQMFINQMRHWALIQNPGVGYDQTDRWNLKNGGSVDCSSFVISCLRIAGFDTGAASVTQDMRSELTALGWVVEPNDGKPQPGDILLADSAHTAAFLGDNLLAEASQNENLGITGGEPGNQLGPQGPLGGETNVHSYYNFPWDCYLRFAEGDDMPLSDDDVKKIADHIFGRNIWGKDDERDFAMTIRQIAKFANTDALVHAIVHDMPEGSGDLTKADVEKAVRRVFHDL